MKVRLLQTDILWADVEQNIENAQRMIDEGEASDLYVLPEMWSTGFATMPAGIAEDEQSSLALQWMKQVASARGCAICGSLAVRVGDCYRNRHYFITPEATTCYDKRHLFAYGHENLHYTRGEKAVIAQWKGFRCLLQTCYDLRFPVFSRYGRAGEYDAIIYVANWPASRMSAWQILTQARAIENQAYVIAVNRCGNDPQTNYVGDSRIIDPVGRIMARIPNTDTGVLDLSVLQQMRQRFRVLDDRD